MVMSVQRQAGCHGFRDLGGFHAKPELYSRKEGEVLQNPLSLELPRANVPPSNDAGGAGGKRRRTRRHALTGLGQQDLK